MSSEALRPAIDHLEQLVEAQAVALDLIGQNAPIDTVLEQLTVLYEQQFAGSVVAIMLTDATADMLRVGWAPRLDAAFLAALERRPLSRAVVGAHSSIDPSVAVSDIATDPLWDNLRPAAEQAGYAARWSVPIETSEGDVLGTFDSYWTTGRQPEGTDLWIQRQFARLLQVTIERYRTVEHISDILNDERRRIAGALHDDSIQAITAVGLRLQRLLSTATPDQQELLRDVLVAVNGAVDRMRHMLFELHPPNLDDDGLESALDLFLDETFDQTGTAWTIEVDLAEEPTSAAAALAYRLASEAITNAYKHAHAQNVAVTVRDHTDGILAIVTDDGDGFDAKRPHRTRAGHLGMTNAAYLAHRAAGTWHIESEVGAGTRVRFWLPSGML